MTQNFNFQLLQAMASIVEIAPLLESLSLTKDGNTSSLATAVAADPKLLSSLTAHLASQVNFLRHSFEIFV